MEGASLMMIDPSQNEDNPQNETELAAPDVDQTSGEPVGESEQAGPEPDPRRIVEAILMASDTQLPAAKIASILGKGTAKDVRRYVEQLNEQYDELGLSFRVEEIAGGYQLLTRPDFNPWLTKLLRVRQETKLTTAAMETLSVVAYKQPCTRAEIEAIRGVAAGDMLNKLREMNLVKIVGRAEDLGRPILYGTTRRFLEVFGLPSLEDLPQVEALKLAPASPAGSDGAAMSETSEESRNDDSASDVSPTAETESN